MELTARIPSSAQPQLRRVARMKAELVPENGDPPIPITRDVTVVGRIEGCDVVIPDPALSKRHCVIVKTDGLLVIRDLATTNGTKVKGQRVRWAALLPDDRITLGGYKLRVYLGPDDAPSPSEASRGRNKSAGKPAAAVPAPLPPKARTSPPPPADQPPAPKVEDFWDEDDSDEVHWDRHDDDVVIELD